MYITYFLKTTVNIFNRINKTTMKNLIIILLATITIVSCTTHKINKISKKEMSEYNIIQDTILHNGEKIAYLNLVEWEYYNNKLVQEISIVQFNQNEQHKTIQLISYIHKKHPSAKIEIKFKSEK